MRDEVAEAKQDPELKLRMGNSQRAGHEVRDVNVGGGGSNCCGRQGINCATGEELR